MDEETQYMQAKNVTLRPDQVRYIESMAHKYRMTFSAALRFLIDCMKQQQEQEEE